MKTLKKLRINEFVEMTDREMKFIVGGGSGDGSGSGYDNNNQDGCECISQCCSKDGKKGKCASQPVASGYYCYTGGGDQGCHQKCT